MGSIFRTADAVGVTKIYLVGYTPDPNDRFGRERNDIAKVALGAEKNIPWEHRDSIEELITELKQEGVEVVALEQHTDSVDYKAYQSEGDVALVLGNEPDGIVDAVLELCDTIIEIPMHGEKESLNVSVAAGIALYRLFDR